MSYSSTRVSWRGDEQVRRNIAEYGRQVNKKAYEFALYWAARLEEHAKLNRPWTDRTANARAALRGYVDDNVPEKFGAEDALDYPTPEQIANDVITIFLSHGMDYGKRLEEAWGAQYAVIMPTIEALLPEIRRSFQEIFR